MWPWVSKIYLICKTQIYGLNCSEISVTYIPIISTIVVFIQNTVPIKIFITCIPFSIRIYISLVRIWNKVTIVFRIIDTIIVFVRITGITRSCNGKIWNDEPFKFKQIYLLNIFVDFLTPHWNLEASNYWKYFSFYT